MSIPNKIFLEFSEEGEYFHDSGLKQTEWSLIVVYNKKNLPFEPHFFQARTGRQEQFLVNTIVSGNDSLLHTFSPNVRNPNG